MSIECYNGLCKYHTNMVNPEADMGPICDEDMCKNEEVIMEAYKKALEARKNKKSRLELNP